MRSHYCIFHFLFISLCRFLSSLKFFLSLIALNRLILSVTSFQLQLPYSTAAVNSAFFHNIFTIHEIKKVYVFCVATISAEIAQEKSCRHFIIGIQFQSVRKQPKSQISMKKKCIISKLCSSKLCFWCYPMNGNTFFIALIMLLNWMKVDRSRKVVSKRMNCLFDIFLSIQ